MKETSSNSTEKEEESVTTTLPSLYPAWHSAVAGGVAGFGSRMTTAPLDLIRIRRQLNATQYPSESVLASWRNIVRTEGGVTALYRGNMAAIYLWVGYATVQFSVYNHTRDFIKFYWKRQAADERPTTTAFVSGACAGLCATLVTYPFDVCRTAFVARGVPSATATTDTAATVASSLTPPPVVRETSTRPMPFSSLVEPQILHPSVPSSAVLGGGATRAPTTTPSPAAPTPTPPKTFAEFARHLYRQQGLRGFYAGAFPAAVQIVPYMGLNFALYDFLTSKNYSSVFLSAYAGSISGAVSKIFVYPIDTVKRRLQAQAFFGGNNNSMSTQLQQYNGMLDCIATIYREEGVASFYRGMVPSVLKTAIASSLAFAFFRWTKNSLEKVHDHRHGVQDDDSSRQRRRNSFKNDTKGTI